MEITKALINEQSLKAKYQTDIKNFWLNGAFSTFQGLDDIRLNFAIFSNPSHIKNIVIVQGRSESYIKYQELAYDLYHQGFNVFILDHRGQGFSERLLDNPHKGYVKDFDDYATDLNTFINTYALPYCSHNAKPYLIAHSMGCAIASLYLIKHPKTIKAAIFSSPMFAINMGKISPRLATGLIFFSSTLEKLIFKTGHFFPGQTNHVMKPFSENKLSHSEVRYTIFSELYKSEKSIQLGGVTIQWLKKAHQIKNKIFKQLDQFTTPVMVLQAGEDTIVDNTAQDEFCQRLFQCQPKICHSNKPIIIEGAWHELFFEKDEYRQPAIAQCLAWFNQHAQPE